MSYNLNFPSQGDSVHVIVNREYRNKPIDTGLLFGVDGVLPEDVISGRTLTRLEDGRVVIPSHDAVVLDNVRNK